MKSAVMSYPQSAGLNSNPVGKRVGTQHEHERIYRLRCYLSTLTATGHNPTMSIGVALTNMLGLPEGGILLPREAPAVPEREVDETLEWIREEELLSAEVLDQLVVEINQRADCATKEQFAAERPSVVL